MIVNRLKVLWTAVLLRIDKFKEHQSHKKDIDYLDFKGRYMKQYVLTLTLIAFLGSAVWVFKDIFMLGSSFVLIDIICRFSGIVWFPALIHFYKKMPRKTWVFSMLIIQTIVIANLFLNYFNCRVSELTGEGWISYYVFFFALSLAADFQWPLHSSILAMTLEIIFTASQFGGPITYTGNIVRPISTGVVLYVGMIFVSVTLRECIYKLYLSDKGITQALKIDMLSQAFNRNIIADIAPNDELEHQSTIMLLDIDCFKEINDTNGHIAGDEAIRFAARSLKQICRKDIDTLIRYGGDEFVIVYQGQIDEKARYEQLQTILASPENKCNITFSAGSYCCKPGERNFYFAIKKADKALYHSKQNGKNQLTLFSEL